MSWAKISICHNIGIIVHDMYGKYHNMILSLGDKNENDVKVLRALIKNVEFHILTHLIPCMFSCVGGSPTP